MRLFDFLKYEMPMWYFNLNSALSATNNFYVDYRSLPSDIVSLLDICEDYDSKDATVADAAYQIIQNGLTVALQSDNIKTLELSGEIKKGEKARNRKSYISSLKDNYRFVRRHFGNSHAIQILIYRISLLKNPIKEIGAYLSSRNIGAVRDCCKEAQLSLMSEFEKFESRLVKSEPKVSVIIPTLNRYEYLDDVLKDLQVQKYSNFEVIVVDQSDCFASDFYNDRQLDLKVCRQREKALWKARNEAIRMAKGRYILLYDDDSRVDSDWIENHLKCIDFFKCDISSGVSLSKVGAAVPIEYSYFKWSAQLDTGNVMFPKSMMEDTGMFDRQFEKQRMGDGEFGLRSYLSGKLNISNPKAKRIHLKVATGGLRQMGAWDAFQNMNLFGPRPIPSILYFCRKYFGVGTAGNLLMTSVPFSMLPYKYKGNKKMRMLSPLIFLMFSPLVAFQVARSWRMSGKMIKQGDLIERL